MSVSLILVPAAIAAVAAWKASRVEHDQTGRQICLVQTRLRDRPLLDAALTGLGAHVTMEGDAVVADWQGVRARFVTTSAGVLEAHLDGDVDTARAEQIVRAVDHAYARLVQQHVQRQVLQRATEMGLVVESQQVNDDESVTLVLEVTR